MVIPPWTFSRIDSFDTCPEKYNAAQVAKTFPDKQNEHSMWGNRVHKALQKRLESKTPLPVGMEQWEPLAAVFDDPGGKLLVEHRYALSRQFGITQWKDAWTRGILDVGVIRKKRAKIYDWKTGKRKVTWQLKLTAAAALHTFPYLDAVDVGFIWLQGGEFDPETFTRDDLPSIWEEIVPKVVRWEAAYRANKWEMRPSGLCRGWCANRACPFNEPRKNDEDRT